MRVQFSEELQVQIPSETDGLQGSSADDPAQKPSLFHLPEWLLRHFRFDRDAIQFGVRMSVCLTVSSLFILIQTPGQRGGFQQGMWVLITVLFVCWFPTLDAASVLEKSFQRLAGTLVGAALGLACGFLSIEAKKEYGIRAQALCLGSCIALVTFAVCGYATARVGEARLIEKKSYATVLCMLTFTICVVPFYSNTDAPWEKSMYRVRNVLIGCVLGVGLSMVVFPRPTVSILNVKITNEIELAAEAAEAVLHTAVDAFAENAYVPAPLARGFLGTSPKQCRSIRKRITVSQRNWRDSESDYSFDYGHDYVVEKYEAALKVYSVVKAQLGKLRYDPFNINRPDDLLQSFKNEVAQTLAITMGIQTTVVLIDGIVRNDPKHKFSEEHLQLLANVGTLVRNMLSTPLDVTESDCAEKELIVLLVQMRQGIVELTATISTSPEMQMLAVVPQSGIIDDTTCRTCAPGLVKGSLMCSLLFLQLVEHLALRSIKLYHNWKKYNGIFQSVDA